MPSSFRAPGGAAQADFVLRLIESQGRRDGKWRQEEQKRELAISTQGSPFSLLVALECRERRGLRLSMKTGLAPQERKLKTFEGRGRSPGSGHTKKRSAMLPLAAKGEQGRRPLSALFCVKLHSLRVTEDEGTRFQARSTFVAAPPRTRSERRLLRCGPTNPAPVSSEYSPESFQVVVGRVNSARVNGRPLTWR